MNAAPRCLRDRNVFNMAPARAQEKKAKKEAKKEAKKVVACHVC
jgi:hypothetical protein